MKVNLIKLKETEYTLLYIALPLKIYTYYPLPYPLPHVTLHPYTLIPYFSALNPYLHDMFDS